MLDRLAADNGFVVKPVIGVAGGIIGYVVYKTFRSSTGAGDFIKRSIRS